MGGASSGTGSAPPLQITEPLVPEMEAYPAQEGPLGVAVFGATIVTINAGWQIALRAGSVAAGSVPGANVLIGAMNSIAQVGLQESAFGEMPDEVAIAQIIVGTFVGSKYGPIPGAIAQLAISGLARIHPSEQGGITLYGAEGYWGLEFMASDTAQAGFPAEASLKIGESLDGLLGRVLDAVGDIVTAPFHAVGEFSEGLLDLFRPEAVAEGRRNLGQIEDPTRSDYTKVSGEIRGTGLRIYDYGTDGDRSNDYFIDAYGRRYDRTPDMLNRTPEEEQRAQENWERLHEFFGGGAGAGGSAQGVGGSGGSGSASGGGGGGSGSGGGGGSSGGRDGSGSGSGRSIVVHDGGSILGTKKKVVLDGGLKDFRPVLLDLDGDGVEVAELGRSAVAMDAEGTGLLHRTAWAGAGDGVLFFDADGDGRISDDREYVFTDWDPTAADDLAALRARFDADGDGRLAGGELAGFHVANAVLPPSAVAERIALGHCR